MQGRQSTSGHPSIDAPGEAPVPNDNNIAPLKEEFQGPMNAERFPERQKSAQQKDAVARKEAARISRCKP